MIKKMQKSANRVPLYEFGDVMWDKNNNCKITDTMHIALLHEELDDHVKDSPETYAANHGRTDSDKVAL